jgi:hypothetical protein
MGAKEEFEKSLAKIGERIAEATTLTVTTTLGSYKVDAGTIKPIDGETLDLVARTVIRIDGDVTNQLPKNPAGDGTLVSKELFDYHQQAVRLGMDTRTAFMEGVAELLRAILPGK